MKIMIGFSRSVVFIINLYTFRISTAKVTFTKDSRGGNKNVEWLDKVGRIKVNNQRIKANILSE